MARFGKGHSCAQAVFTAFAEQMGVDYRTAMNVASGFGGGMYSGSVCGTVTGAYMALGLKYGGDATAPMPKVVKEFADRFKAKHRFVSCSDLLAVDLGKVDLSNPEEVKALKEKVMKDKNPSSMRCGTFVRDAAEIVDALMSKAPLGVTG
jgi:C_GCAxxG_C_C family probable redox protein